MLEMDITNLTAYELAEKVRRKEIKPSEVMKSTLQNIEEKDKHLKAFLTVEDKKALEEAEKLESSLNEKSLLCGVPVANKDNILIKGRVSACASKIL